MQHNSHAALQQGHLQHTFTHPRAGSPIPGPGEKYPLRCRWVTPFSLCTTPWPIPHPSSLLPARHISQPCKYCNYATHPVHELTREPDHRKFPPLPQFCRLGRTPMRFLFHFLPTRQASHSVCSGAESFVRISFSVTEEYHDVYRRPRPSWSDAILSTDIGNACPDDITRV
jgi:hypothetical protein